MYVYLYIYFFYGPDERHGDDRRHPLPPRPDRNTSMYTREYADDVTAGTAECRERMIMIIILFDTRGCSECEKRPGREIDEIHSVRARGRVANVSSATAPTPSVEDTRDPYGAAVTNT